MGYCYMSVTKIKTLASMDKKHRHNYRLDDVPNADIERAHLNDELVKLNGISYVDAFRNRLQELAHYKNGGKVRKNGVLGFEINTTFSREDRSKVDIERWKQKNIEWAKENFNANKNLGENVISAIFHDDECGNIHCHIVVIPIDDKGKLNASYYVGNRQKMITLQDSYAKFMNEFGLERGLKGSKAKHTDIQKFYAAINEAVSKELPPVEKKGFKMETAEEYRKRANEEFIKNNLQHIDKINKMQRKIDEAKTYDLQDKIEISREYTELEKTIKELEGKLEKVDELEREYGPVPTIEAKLTTLKLLNEGMPEFTREHPDQMEYIRELQSKMNEIVKWKKKKNEEKGLYVQKVKEESKNNIELSEEK